MGEVEALIPTCGARAAKHGRTLRFGYRVHVIVRATETEARQAARRLRSAGLRRPETSRQIRDVSLHPPRRPKLRHGELRDNSDEEGFVEDFLWTRDRRGRSGAGAGDRR